MTRQREKSERGVQVQLDLRSVHGVSWRADKDAENAARPSMMAVVAFTGSATDMMVSSSTMCSRTGHMVIESSPLRIDAQEQNDRPDRHCPLYATFQRRRSQATPSVHSTCSSSVSSHQPHVRVQLPQRDDNVPSVSFEKTNRDCRVVRRHSVSQTFSDSFKDASDATAEEAATTATPTETTTTTDTTPGLEWGDQSEASMPEILELHVSIRSDDNRILQEGIAHLVLFGSLEDSAISTVEIPIKRHCSVDPSETNPGIIIEDDAFVRMNVYIGASSDDISSPCASRCTATTEECSVDTNDDDEEDMKHPLDLWQMEEKQRHNEEKLEEARVKSAEMAFDEMAVEASSQRSLSCGSMDLRQIMLTLTDAFRCSDKTAREEEDGCAATLMEASTMGSTIVTRASMGL